MWPMSTPTPMPPYRSTATITWWTLAKGSVAMASMTDDTRLDSEPPTYAGWRILVPLHEPPQALPALVYAHALARASRGELKLLRATGVESEAGVNSLANHAELATRSHHHGHAQMVRRGPL